MTIPAFIFGSFFSLLIGSFSHLILGGNLKKLILFLILGWIGFWAGYLLASQIGISFLQIGPLNLGVSSIGSVVFILFGFWVSMENVDQNNKDK
jgi:hypothetical protein